MTLCANIITELKTLSAASRQQQLLQQQAAAAAAQQQAMQQGGEPMSPEEMAGLGTDEDEVMRQLQANPDMMNRVPTDNQN